MVHIFLPSIENRIPNHGGVTTRWSNPTRQAGYVFLMVGSKKRLQPGQDHPKSFTDWKSARWSGPGDAAAKARVNGDPSS